MNKQSKYPECELKYQEYWMATHVDYTMTQEDFDDWLNEYCYQCKHMSEICMYGEEVVATVQELINILSKYEPSALVYAVKGHKLHHIESVRPTVDMDTNLIEATIFIKENT